ncbi:MAG: lysophospholipid acyltransferase family protein [Myxococcaceae bacterium]
MSLGGLAIGLGVRLVRALPRRLGLGVGAFIGWLTWALHIRRRVALDNLAHAFPEKSDAERRDLARQAYRAMAVAMYESLTSDLLSKAELDAAVKVTDWKGLDALLAARKPVLIASAHLGSWELFAEIMARRGFVFSAVVRPLSGAFNEWLLESRTRAGVELIFQRGALRGMLRALQQGRAVVQLIDQALPAREAVWPVFFGRPASTTPALSMAAVRSGAPVYVVVAVRHGDALEMSVEGPVPVPSRPTRREAVAAHVQALTSLIETHVRRAPGQWLWLHRRWKGQPPAAR